MSTVSNFATSCWEAFGRSLPTVGTDREQRESRKICFYCFIMQPRSNFNTQNKKQQKFQKRNVPPPPPPSRGLLH